MAVFQVVAGGDGEDTLVITVYSFDGGSFSYVGDVVDTLLERPAAVADMVGDLTASKVLSCGERAGYLCGGNRKLELVIFFICY